MPASRSPAKNGVGSHPGENLRALARHDTGHRLQRAGGDDIRRALTAGIRRGARPAIPRTDGRQGPGGRSRPPRRSRRPGYLAPLG